MQQAQGQGGQAATFAAGASGQQHQQFQQARPARRRASVIAVTSGKGGVGKSNVAVNLAIKLAGAGKTVVCSTRT